MKQTLYAVTLATACTYWCRVGWVAVLATPEGIYFAKLLLGASKDTDLE
jgi:hypothetical protein